MRLTATNNSLGCVSSTLEEAGTTWLNYQGGQRSAKVFKVTPATNGGSTNYTLSLYFTNAELDGKNAAALRIAKTTAANVAASNVTNTVLVTPTVTTLGSGTSVFTANFSGFSSFFLVDDVVVLAAELTEFSVKLTTEQNALLSWTTATELNNRQFDIELSRNGIDFDVIGTLASEGNSITDQYYEFLHVKPQPGISFYRLKQTDHDGKYSYSKIISLSVNPALTRAFVYPVPAKNLITINFGIMTNTGELSIYSADMKLVKTERISGPIMTRDINISNLPKGTYFIRYAQGKIVQSFPFIKD